MKLFLRPRVEDLEIEVKYLKELHKGDQAEIWSLRRDLNRLMTHLKLEFKDVNERKVEKLP